MSRSEPLGFIDTIEEDPNGALYQQVEGLLENFNGLMARHDQGPCMKQGYKRTGGPFKGTFTGCPRCRKITQDPFLGWRMEIVLDYLCGGGDPATTPDYPTGEEP